jgi:hypothetical protein
MAKGSALLKWYKPSVDRYWLLLLAGIMWSLVGLGLCAAACHWLASLAWPGNLVTAIAGFVCGVLAYAFAFSRIVRRNLTRIAEQPARVCLFAFQAWRSYALIFVMMLTGWLLRHSRLPVLFLAAIYLAVGTALALASSLYYEQL